MSFNNGKTLEASQVNPKNEKAPDGTTLKDYLGLTAKEEQRLNQLSLTRSTLSLRSRTFRHVRY